MLLGLPNFVNKNLKNACTFFSRLYSQIRPT